ncbi:hypothetical protein QTP88_007058 [Uroleucon formosanum]
MSVPTATEDCRRRYRRDGNWRAIGSDTVFPVAEEATSLSATAAARSTHKFATRSAAGPRDCYCGGNDDDDDGAPGTHTAASVEARELPVVRRLCSTSFLVVVARVCRVQLPITRTLAQSPHHPPFTYPSNGRAAPRRPPLISAPPTSLPVGTSSSSLVSVVGLSYIPTPIHIIDISWVVNVFIDIQQVRRVHAAHGFGPVFCLLKPPAVVWGSYPLVIVLI